MWNLHMISCTLKYCNEVIQRVVFQSNDVLQRYWPYESVCWIAHIFKTQNYQGHFLSESTVIEFFPATKNTVWMFHNTSICTIPIMDCINVCYLSTFTVFQDMLYMCTERMVLSNTNDRGSLCKYKGNKHMYPTDTTWVLEFPGVIKSC